MFDNLLISIRTKDDRAEALAILNAYKQAKYKVNGESADITPYSAKLVQKISLWVQSGPNTVDYEQLEQRIKGMKLVHLDLALEPSTLFLEKLSERVKQLFGADCILEYFVDSHMLTGIRISFDGVYWDHSGKGLLQQNPAWNQLIKDSFQL